MMKITSKLAFVLTLAAPAIASAGITAAARIDLVPTGSVHIAADVEGASSENLDMAFAYGLAGQVDYWVNEQISVGIAPRYLLNINGEDDDEDEAGTQLDIPVRAAYNHKVNEKLQAFGFASIGFSVLMPPSSADAENATGLAIGFGAGGRYALSDKLFAAAELGYEIGFQGSTVDVLGTSVDVTTAPRFLRLGLGVGSHF